MRSNNKHPSPSKGEGKGEGKARYGFKAEVMEALAIARTLYEKDKARYKPVFEFINSSVMRRKSPAMILQCVRRLSERETLSLDGREKGEGANPVTDVREYLGGTLRKLETERESKRLRKDGGGPSLLGDILNKAQAQTSKSET